jgi:hypothetical protein
VKKTFPNFLILFLIFFTVFVVHSLSSCVTSFDSKFSIHTAQSILKEGNTNLDEYLPQLREADFYPTIQIDGHYYVVYPIGASLFAVPFVALFDALGYDVATGHEFVELIVSSFAVALTTVFIFLIARLYLNIRLSILTVFIFAFCTSTWSAVSRALWQHGPSMLTLTVALYMLLLARRKPMLVQFVSLPLALSYIMRPTNSLSIIFLSLFVLLQYRRYFVRYVLWSLVVAGPFLAYNFSIYHAPFSPYYVGNQGLGFSLSSLGEGLVGTTLSPSRGLFIFTPILLFSIWGMVMRIRQEKREWLDYFLIGIIIFHWLTISVWVIWWAGHSYGPRIFSDVLPYFVYFLIPVLQHAPKLKGVQRWTFTTVFAGLLVVSFLIHYRGATSWDVHYWNVKPTNVNEDLSRLWDWKDIQFLRGL